ncbi:MAG: carbohydrate ABC transporter permease [Propioniciclava sp.]
MLEKLTLAVGAVLIGVLGAVALFWVLNKLVEMLPKKWELRFKPYALLLPAAAVIITFLIYPAVTTVYASLFNAKSTEFVGLANFINLFGNRIFQSTLINNLLWILVAPTLIVAFGLLVAVLADRLKPTQENVAKSLVFLPMAISMVGAATIWNLIYAFKPGESAQIGLLNAVVVALGGEPQTWLAIEAWRFNTFLLMVVFIWTQVGYAMVLLSAALKGVPEDTVEAGRIDGANERQIFFRIIVPQAWPTVITVFITVLISAMKVFDIVYTMTNGNYNTNVIGNLFYNTMFKSFDTGTASAIVVVLMIMVVPILVYQVRQFRIQEANS